METVVSLSFLQGETLEGKDKRTHFWREDTQDALQELLEVHCSPQRQTPDTDLFAARTAAGEANETAAEDDVEGVEPGPGPHPVWELF